jgi:hypothetical protein
MWSLLLCGVQMRQSSNFSSRSAATPHKLRRGTRRSKRCTTSTSRRRRGFWEGADNRKKRYPLECNLRASERMHTAKETCFTNVVCVRVNSAPWTHESFYVKYKVSSDFQCKVWTSIESCQSARWVTRNLFCWPARDVGGNKPRSESRRTP